MIDGRLKFVVLFRENNVRIIELTESFLEMPKEDEISTKGKELNVSVLNWNNQINLYKGQLRYTGWNNVEI